MNFFATILSVVYPSPESLNSSYVVDIGCGSINTTDMHGSLPTIWEPWFSRLLNEIKGCNIIGIDKYNNEKELFNTLKLDIYHFLSFTNNIEGNMILGKKVDLVINSNFTGLDKSDNFYKVSPALIYRSMKKEKGNNNFKEINQKLNNFKLVLSKYVYNVLNEGGIYLVISGNEFIYYQKNKNRLRVFKQGRVL